MNDFHPVYPDITGLDPYKRVRYTEGMVLGIDEFLQEELYLLEKHRRHNRSLHGYGTVCGLRVEAGDHPDNSDDIELKVHPGVALDPRGRETRVSEAKCASVNQWLVSHREEVLDWLGSPGELPATVSLYVVLCHRECETDYAPVPSGPCKSLDRSQAPTRIADDHELIVTPDAPQQVEEDEIRELRDLLAQIEIRDAGDGLSLDNIISLVRALKSDGSPPAEYSPPLGGMHMRPDEAELFIRTALRVWVTEVRPVLLESGRNCAHGPSDDSCVLLARVDVDIEDTSVGLRLQNTTVSVDEDDRPFLLQTRLLQAQLIQGLAAGTESASSGGGGGGSSSTIDESNLMHLTGDESVEGVKTFTDPIALGQDGRVERRIMLPPMAGALVNSKVTHDFFRAGVPALRFENGGEASFTLQIPDDIEYGVAPSVRLVWGVRNNLSSINFTWKVRNRYAEPETTIGPFSGGTLSETATEPQSGQVYATRFHNLPDSVHEGDIFGALRVTLSDVEPAEEPVYILHVEVAYNADRLGRPVT